LVDWGSSGCKREGRKQEQQQQQQQQPQPHPHHQQEQLGVQTGLLPIVLPIVLDEQQADSHDATVNLKGIDLQAAALAAAASAAAAVAEVQQTEMAEDTPLAVVPATTMQQKRNPSLPPSLANVAWARRSSSSSSNACVADPSPHAQTSEQRRKGSHRRLGPPHLKGASAVCHYDGRHRQWLSRFCQRHTGLWKLRKFNALRHRARFHIPRKRQRKAADKSCKQRSSQGDCGKLHLVSKRPPPMETATVFLSDNNQNDVVALSRRCSGLEKLRKLKAARLAKQKLHV